MFFFEKQVKTWKMHLFTILQTLGLVVLWIVKSSVLALAFPFFVLGMVPYRMAFKFIFTSMELEAVSMIYIVLNLWTCFMHSHYILHFLLWVRVNVFDFINLQFFYYFRLKRHIFKKVQGGAPKSLQLYYCFH